MTELTEKLEMAVNEVIESGAGEYQPVDRLIVLVGECIGALKHQDDYKASMIDMVKLAAAAGYHPGDL